MASGVSHAPRGSQIDRLIMPVLRVAPRHSHWILSLERSYRQYMQLQECANVHKLHGVGRAAEAARPPVVSIGLMLRYERCKISICMAERYSWAREASATLVREYDWRAKSTMDSSSSASVRMRSHFVCTALREMLNVTVRPVKV